MTKAPEMRDKSVVRLSVTPSTKYSCWGPPPRCAEVGQPRLEPSQDVLIGRSRNEDAARRRDLFEPRRDIDAVADEIVPFDQHVAKMDPHPVAKAFGLGYALVQPRRLGLQRERALHGRDDGREFDQESVAHRLEYAPAVRGDDRPCRGSALAYRFRRALFVLAHHARVADDVGGENGGEAAGGHAAG